VKFCIGHLHLILLCFGESRDSRRTFRLDVNEIWSARLLSTADILTVQQAHVQSVHYVTGSCRVLVLVSSLRLKTALSTPVQCPLCTKCSYVAVDGHSLQLVSISVKGRTTEMQVTVRMINDVSCMDCLMHTDWLRDMQKAYSHLQNVVTCKNHRQEYLKCALSCQTVGNVQL
jgi:hypothetical protein